MLNLISTTKTLLMGKTACICGTSFYSTKPVLPNSNSNLPEFAATASKVFLNPGLDRKQMSFELKGKSGIYCFFNKSNGKYYVGSGVDLNRRINLYFQNSWLQNHSNMIIVKAILRYGIDKFALFILEFCDRDNCLSRENHFISSLNPSYNIYKTAGSPLGYKHTLQNIAKIRKAALFRTFSKETIRKMSEAAKTRFSKTGQPGFSLSILDLVTGKSTNYLSISQAARELGLNPSSVSKRLKKGNTTAFKGRNVLTLKPSAERAPK